MLKVQPPGLHGRIAWERLSHWYTVSPVNKIRPIAIGLIFRRLISRLLAARAQNDPALHVYIHPRQLSVCARGGAEVIIHATRAVVNARVSEN